MATFIASLDEAAAIFGDRRSTTLGFRRLSQLRDSRTRRTLNNSVGLVFPADRTSSPTKAPTPVVALPPNITSFTSGTIPVDDAAALTAEFLEGVYSLDRAGLKRQAVGHVVNWVDDLLCEGRFADCDAILAVADEDKLSSHSIVAMLGITFAASQKLKERSRFFDRALSRVSRDRGNASATRLLAKYK